MQEEVTISTCITHVNLYAELVDDYVTHGYYAKHLCAEIFFSGG
jgi:hypothetical protein